MPADSSKSTLPRATCRSPRSRTRRSREARKFAALGRLAPGIAHELNTPTQYIGDNLRFLLHAFQQLTALPSSERHTSADGSSELEYLLEEIPSAISQSLDGVGQVAHLVDAMKRFATAPVGAAVALDLNQVVESVVALARNEWKYAAVVVCDLDAMRPLVWCAEAEARQAVLTLVCGAARAVARTSVVGRISVSTRRDQSCVELAVHGPSDARGMEHGGDPAERAWSRALASTRLSLAEYGGTVERVTGGDGTTVIVRLPRPIDERTPPTGGDSSGADKGACA